MLTTPDDWVLAIGGDTNVVEPDGHLETLGEIYSEETSASQNRDHVEKINAAKIVVDLLGNLRDSFLNLMLRDKVMHSRLRPHVGSIVVHLISMRRSGKRRKAACETVSTM